MKNKQDGFSKIALVLIIVALGVVGSYFLFQKKTTQNFKNRIVEENKIEVVDGESRKLELKTYTNTQYGFEFKYPSNLKIEEQKLNNDLQQNLLLYLIACKTDQKCYIKERDWGGDFIVTVMSNFNKLDLKKFLEVNVYSLNYTDTSINGNPAVIFNDDNTASGGRTIVIQHNDYILQFSSLGFETPETIYQTFKFYR